MVRAGLIIAISGTILIVLGCSGQSADRPVYEQVKIYDLIPSPSVSTQPRQQGLIELDTHIFELPAANLPLLADLWNSVLSDSPLKYRSAKAFKASGFVAAAGTLNIRDEIDQVLRAAESRKARTVSLLLFKTQSDYVSVASVEDERTFFYAEPDGKVAGLSLSNGLAAFRIKVDGIPGTRGAVRMSLQPVFRSSVAGRTGKLATRTNYEDIVFDSIGLEMQMSPGQFILLGPGEYGGGQMSLSRLFFSHSKPRPIARLYLILCRNISD
jgi:hypothetical protein